MMNYDLKCNRKTINKNIFCILLAFLFMLTMLYFMAFEASHAVHECTGEDCPICHELHIAQSITQNSGNLGVLTVAVFLAVVMVTKIVPTSFGYFISRTPITNKVRLDD